MGINTSPAAFSRQRTIMETALEREQLRVWFPSKTEAIKFRHRCYSVRKALRKENLRQHNRETSDYDEIVISLEEHPDGKVSLFFQCDYMTDTGIVVEDPNTGEVVDV